MRCRLDIAHPVDIPALGDDMIAQGIPQDRIILD
jgi:hypothetical protein